MFPHEAQFESDHDLIRAARAISTAAFVCAAEARRRVVLLEKVELSWGRLLIENGQLIMEITMDITPLPSDGPRAERSQYDF